MLAKDTPAAGGGGLPAPTSPSPAVPSAPSCRRPPASSADSASAAASSPSSTLLPPAAERRASAGRGMACTGDIVDVSRQRVLGETPAVQPACVDMDNYDLLLVHQLRREQEQEEEGEVKRLVAAAGGARSMTMISVILEPQ